jgi:hypothetical protein
MVKCDVTNGRTIPREALDFEQAGVAASIFA